MFFFPHTLAYQLLISAHSLRILFFAWSLTSCSKQFIPSHPVEAERLYLGLLTEYFHRKCSKEVAQSKVQKEKKPAGKEISSLKNGFISLGWKVPHKWIHDLLLKGTSRSLTLAVSLEARATASEGHLGSHHNALFLTALLCHCHPGRSLSFKQQTWLLPFHSCFQKDNLRFNVMISKKVLFKNCGCDMYYHLLINHRVSSCTCGKREIKGAHVWAAKLCALHFSFSSEIQCNNYFLKNRFSFKNWKWVANEVG